MLKDTIATIVQEGYVNKSTSIEIADKIINAIELDEYAIHEQACKAFQTMRDTLKAISK